MAEIDCWAVVSHVEPPMSLHRASPGSTPADSDADLPTYVCHFPFPLPSLLVVYWIGRQPASDKSPDVHIAVYAAVRRDAEPQLLGRYPLEQGAAAIAVRWPDADVAFAAACPERMGKLTVHLECGTAASTPPRIASDGAVVGTAAAAKARAGTGPLPTPPHHEHRDRNAAADRKAPPSPLRPRDTNVARAPTVVDALMRGARKLAATSGKQASDDAPTAAPEAGAAPAPAPAEAMEVDPPQAAPPAASAAARDPEPAAAAPTLAPTLPPAPAGETPADPPAAAAAADDDDDTAAPTTTPPTMRQQPPRQGAAVKRKAAATESPASASATISPKARARLAPASSGADATHPAGRWGHSSVWCNGRMYTFLGQGHGGEWLDDSVWCTDTVPAMAEGEPAWTHLTPTGQSPGKRIGQAAAAVGNVVYTVGGSKSKRWLSDIYAYDVATNAWALVPATGKAPAAAYHSVTAYKNELVVFGGVRDTVCLNDVAVYNLEQGMWYRPSVSGDLPAPRSGHTATLVGELLVIIGGWDQPLVFNDVYTLDLVFMTFTKHETTGDGPSPRSWHAAALLPNGTIFVYGGFNGDAAMNDAYILDPATWTWRKVSDNLLPNGRAGHTAVAVCTPEAASSQGSVAIFGGGDNEGRWFDGCMLVPFSALM